MPENGSASLASDPVSGLNLPESFASYDPATCLWKTSQRSFIEELTRFSATWPRSGTMRNGSAYLLPPWVCRITVTGFSLWPTPTASQARDLEFSMEQAIKRLRRNQRNGFQTGAASGSLTDRVIDECGGYPTAEFVELLMGFPLGWTDLED